jgi:hypothetical protein
MQLSIDVIKPVESLLLNYKILGNKCKKKFFSFQNLSIFINKLICFSALNMIVIFMDVSFNHS